MASGEIRSLSRSLLGRSRRSERHKQIKHKARACLSVRAVCLKCLSPFFLMIENEVSLRSMEKEANRTICAASPLLLPPSTLTNSSSAYNLWFFYLYKQVHLDAASCLSASRFPSHLLRFDSFKRRHMMCWYRWFTARVCVHTLRVCQSDWAPVSALASACACVEVSVRACMRVISDAAKTWDQRAIGSESDLIANELIACKAEWR